MGFRDKLRAKMGSKRSPDSSSGGSTPKSGSTGETHYTNRTDIEYYLPHEIPKPKYKGKVDPQHSANLQSYSFGDAFRTVRRKSSQALSGIMSPGGTKSQSRRASYVSTHTMAATPAAEKYNPLSRTVSSAEPPLGLVREESGERTPANGDALTQQATVTQAPQVRLPHHDSSETPFSSEELERALSAVDLNSQRPHIVAVEAH